MADKQNKKKRKLEWGFELDDEYICNLPIKMEAGVAWDLKTKNNLLVAVLRTVGGRGWRGMWEGAGGERWNREVEGKEGRKRKSRMRRG